MGIPLGLSWLDGSVSAVLSCGKVVKNSFNFPLLSNHVEVNTLLICKCLVHFPFSSGLKRLLGY